MIFLTFQDSGSLNIFGQNHIPSLSLDLVDQKKENLKKKFKKKKWSLLCS